MSQGHETDRPDTSGSHDASVEHVIHEVFAEYGAPHSMDDVRRMVEAARQRGDTSLGSVPTGTMGSQEEWTAYARWIARFACQALFPIRRGVIIDSERNVVVYFDNNPLRKRDDAQAAMVMALAARGVPLVSTGASPDEYASAHVFRGWRNTDVVRSVISHTIRAFGLGHGEIGTHMS